MCQFTSLLTEHFDSLSERMKQHGKALFRNDEFMEKLMNSYIMSTVEQFDLNCTTARVLLNAMPGLESVAVFQDMVSLASSSKSFNSQDLIYILSSSCYTFPWKLVMRIWCFTLFTLLFFYFLTYL